MLQLDGAADPRPCDAAAPAPAISDVGLTALPAVAGRPKVSVSWRTDREADSTVLFRPRGATAWTQVSEAAGSTVHALTVSLPAGADPAAFEVAVRSSGCNGAATTDDAGGAGYTFAPTAPAVGAGAQVAPFPPRAAGSSGTGAAAVANRSVPNAADVDAGTAVCSSAAGSFVPLAPSRLLDTRDGTGAAAAGPVVGGRPIDLQVTGRGGVPASGVSAVVLNLTAVDLKGAAASFVTAYPVGTPLPTASNLNVVPGPAVPNLVTVRVGQGGKVSLYDQLGTVHLVADVAGYYQDATVLAPATTFVPVNPVRLLDTRDGTGAPKGKVGAGRTIDLTVAGPGGVPATGVRAVVLNLTATGLTGSAASFVTAYPADVARPLASNVNVAGASPVPNLVTVATSPTGVVRLYNFQGNLDLVADVTGYYTDDGTGSRFVPVDPVRLLDTRSGNGAPQAKVGPGGTVTTALAGRLGVPSAAVTGVVVNLTGVSPSSATFLTAYPAGGTRPLASNLNLVKGQIDPNLVVIGLGDLAATIYNQQGTVDLVADVAGVFVR